MVKKSFLLLGLFCCVTAARAAETCDAGYYLNGGTCTPCSAGTYKDTTGPQECTACPAADETTLRTTIPDTYYPYDSVTGTYVKTTVPTFIRTHIPNWGFIAEKAITRCFVVSDYKNAASNAFVIEGIYYNPTTGKYDANDGAVRYYTVNPGYYLDTRFRDTYCSESPGRVQYYKNAIVCPPGYYCPGVSARSCSDGTYDTERGRTICPVGHYCPAGAVAPTPCSAGHYCPAGAAAPTPCPAGTYSDTIGASDDSVCKPCTNAPGNTHYTGGGTTNSCPWECDDGYVRRGNECSQLCTGGMRYIKTSNGLQFNLYQVAYSTPALHVKHNDTVCHAVLVPGAAANAININHNGQIYHTVD